MIRLGGGKEVKKFLDRVERHPDRYDQVVISSPFLDEGIADRLVRIARLLSKRGAGFRLYTSTSVAEKLRARPVGRRFSRLDAVVAVNRLHHKFYWATGRMARASLAIVTSANCTRDGMSRNYELGITATARSSEGRDVIAAVRQYSGRLRRMTCLGDSMHVKGVA